MDLSWSLHRRKGIFYCQLKNNHTGKYLSARSTRTTNEKEALLVVADWIKNGLPPVRSNRNLAVETALSLDTILWSIRRCDFSPSDAERIVRALQEKQLLCSAVVADSPGSEPFGEYLVRFWTYDASPYVKEKLAHGHRIGRRHCRECLNRVKLYWVPSFRNRFLADVTRVGLKSFGEDLAARGLAAGSVNKILTAGTTALKWACTNGLIEANPAVGLMRYSGRPEKRGVLSPEEARALFSLTWRNQLARVANLLAAVTGLRSGEIRALRVQDIADDRIHVRHAWSNLDGLKAPKNGEERTVPILPRVREELLALARTNPYGYSDQAFVFYSTLPDKPCDLKLFSSELKKELIRLSIGDSTDPEKRREAEKEWSKRAIVFHSWRHFYAARLADRVDIRRVQLATGHKSAVMAEHYADHALDADFKIISSAVENAFGSLVAS